MTIEAEKTYSNIETRDNIGREIEGNSTAYRLPNHKEPSSDHIKGLLSPNSSSPLLSFCDNCWPNAINLTNLIVF